jgi:hypothetical protein
MASFPMISDIMAMKSCGLNKRPTRAAFKAEQYINQPIKEVVI